MNNKENYPTWLVPLDIAQELKAIGFDVPCHFHFLYYHGWEMLKKRGAEYGFITSNSCRAYLVENHNAIGKLSVPTWEQVFQWFREKGFYSYIVKKSSPERYVFYIICGMITCSNENLKADLLPISYEESREELIYKLIEMYKETKMSKK